MSHIQYREKITGVLNGIFTTQGENIEKAAKIMADCVANKGLIHLFGSGHSVLPVQDIFPRYGAYPVFRPLMDSRLMWTNVIGSGGAKGLLWLERREGYAQVLFENEPIRNGDVMIVFSHGGLNAAGIEVALESKKRGLAIIAVTSMQNYKVRQATHSTGKKLADCADVVIDNCCPPEDALVKIEGWKAPVAASSTVATVTISMQLVAQLAAELASRGMQLPVFVSPNVPGIPANNNDTVYEQYESALHRV